MNRSARHFIETKWTEKEIGFQVNWRKLNIFGNEGFLWLSDKSFDNAISSASSKDNYDVSETRTGILLVHSQDGDQE